MPKSKDAFRTISEVAEWLDVQPHVLRFWESKFSQVRPVKRAGGRRYYRPNDMLLIGGIKQLLHDDGMTIKGVQKLLREKGIKEISALSRPIEDGTDDSIEHLQDPAPVTEADLIGDIAPVTPVRPKVPTKAEPSPEPQAAKDVAIEAEPAISALPQEAPEAESVEPPALRPEKPVVDDAEGWEVRRKILARLTELRDIPEADKAVIGAAVHALAAVQAKHRGNANP